ncbi:arsenate reductase ArsC [Endozoicomonas numazuensis]|uniref:Arsenate reductase n=1 Tax=Endozoicomonas numazuensis TaxID=1137799 RepID=A0A081NK73_9GAMM|nr:arsenate reductase ArsC [Endozoicomonas numazuensis]KEQ18846.1 arsenate reductase [Endozoicomonas numazuensis]
MDTTRILFLCTGNSCRSQMAEGWARHILPSDYETFSAGIEAHGLNPSAVKVMQEAGIDISRQQSQTLNDLDQKQFDFIITVCDHAHKTCPTPEQGQIILKRFDDPPRLAESVKTEEESLAIYRRVRDEIRVWVNQLPSQIQQMSN